MKMKLLQKFFFRKNKKSAKFWQILKTEAILFQIMFTRSTDGVNDMCSGDFRTDFSQKLKFFDRTKKKLSYRGFEPFHDSFIDSYEQL